VEIERVVLSNMTYEIEKIDITSLSNDEDVIREIASVILKRGYGKSVALRVILEGSVPSDYLPNIKRIESLAQELGLLLLQVKNECVSNFDLDYLEEDMSVRGEVYRRLLPLLNSADESERAKGSLALRFALASLDKRELSID
jgi:hypothetical protein